MDSITTFTILGIALYLLVIGIIGYKAWKTNIPSDSSDWYLMGRSAGMLMLVGTLFATWFSTFAFLGGPGAFYASGVDWLLFGFFNSMGPLLIMFFGVRMWIIARRYGHITPADMLAGYYDDSKRIRYLTAAICMTVLFPYAAIQLSGIATALASISNQLVPYEAGIIGLAICVAVYAVIGGARAIIWTDVIQGFIFAALIVITAILVIGWSGGWAQGWQNAIAAQPDKFIFEGDTHGTYVTLLLLWTFGWVLTPHLWQRMYMARSASTLVSSSLIASFLALLVVTFTGAIIGFLSMGMEVNLAGLSTDALVPTLYREYLPIGGAVLVVAVFAAGMSTLDSQIMSASSVFSEDLYSRMGRSSSNTERGHVRAGRVFETVFVLLLVAFVLSDGGRQLLVPLASIGVGMALSFLFPLLGCLFWPRASEAGAFYAMLSGWTVMLLMQFGLLPNPGIYGPPLWGFIVSAITFYTVSMLTPPVSEAKRDAYHGLIAKTLCRRAAPETEAGAAA